MNDAKSIAATSAMPDPFRVSAAMLVTDGWQVLWFYLLTVSSTLVHYVPINGWFGGVASPTLILQPISHLVQLWALGRLSQRWLKRFSSPEADLSLSSWTRFLTIAFVFWVAILLPGVTLLSAGFVGQVLAGVVMALGIGINLRYYFFFLTAWFRPSTVTSTLQRAHQIARAAPLLPLQTLLFPYGLTCLLMMVSLAPAPDGHLWWTQLLFDLSSGVGWLLGSYLGVAAGLVLLAHKPSATTAPAADPAPLLRFERSASGYLSDLIRPSRGMLLFALSVLVWMGNMSRLWTTPPTAAIGSVEVSLEEGGPRNARLVVTFTATDAKYQFRGFRPHFFRVADEHGSAVAQSPLRAELLNSDGSTRTPFPTLSETPELATTLRIQLLFQSEDTIEHLRSLKNLFVWYRGVKIAPLQMTKVPGSSLPAGSADITAPRATPIPSSG